jgi:hypothetical protein
VQPDKRFAEVSPRFWANVRAISETLGYTVRGKGTIKTHSIAEIGAAMTTRGLGKAHVCRQDGSPTELGQLLVDYFVYRAARLNDDVQGWLMDVDAARDVYEGLKSELSPTCPLPMNKQTKEKREPAFLTCIVNMIIEREIGELPCDYDPRALTSFTNVNGGGRIPTSSV